VNSPGPGTTIARDGNRRASDGVCVFFFVGGGGGGGGAPPQQGRLHTSLGAWRGLAFVVNGGDGRRTEGRMTLQ